MKVFWKRNTDPGTSMLLLPPQRNIARTRLLTVTAAGMLAASSMLAQVDATHQTPEIVQIAQHQQKLQKVMSDKKAYAIGIVSRFESAARASGKFDENYSEDLYNALMKLQPENLLAAGEASSYEAMMNVLARGTAKSPKSVNISPDVALPEVLGNFSADLVYTPVTPCRIVDTRSAGGALAAGSIRAFDVDGSSFAGQGGYAGSCGLPYGAPTAVAMTIHSITPSAGGYFKVWAVGQSQPTASVLNFIGGESIANTSIVPVLPGAGNDFYVSTSATSQLVIDVVGYFAAPVATALDCTTVASPITAVDVNVWTSVDVACPAGFSATGGGTYPSEGTLGWPGVWITNAPAGNGWRTYVDNQTNGPRHVATYATCCRVPGR